MGITEVSVENPFAGKKPDEMSASYVAKYFVDTHTDFKKILEPTNSFINGARGTGKSMFLRSLEMTVASERSGIPIMKLDSIGIHVPLRKEDFGITEISNMINAEGPAVGEHLLIMSISYHLLRNLLEASSVLDGQLVQAFYSIFTELFIACGGKIPVPSADLSSPENKLHHLKVTCERSNTIIRQHAKRMVLDESNSAYNGALCGLRDFFLPLIEETKFSGYLPEKPFFIMLDDADNLPKSMQRIINSWISMRVYPRVCLKVSTQLGYATFRTLDNRRIESPHDFNSIDVGSVYTNSSDRYSKRIRDIVERRLSLASIDISPADFFPEDVDQKQRLEEIKSEIKREFHKNIDNPNKKGSSRVHDEVTRYAVPRLMRELYKSKSSHTFSYAGYDSLVNLSSGIIRWFLEPAAQMFDEMCASSPGQQVSSIPVVIQDRIIYRWSKEFADELSLPEGDEEFDSDSPHEDSSLHQIHDSEILGRLHNLISALGLFFRHRLLNEDASEQRAFSVVVRGQISKELQEVLSLGIRLGYLQRSDNSAKEMNATRRPRYILARRLGPSFKLDISGYAAHLSVTASQLEKAIVSPQSFVKLKTKAAENGQENDQYVLDLEIDDDD